MTEHEQTARNSFKARKAIKYFCISLLVLALGVRVYAHFIPWGASITPFILASDAGPVIDSPDHSRTLNVYFNDAGAMHSGNHWTWVVEDHWFWGRLVVAEGYLDFGIRKGDAPIPIHWTDGDTFTIDFTTRH